MTESGAEGIRTPGLLIANETRYQLRHSPKRGKRLSAQDYWRSDASQHGYSPAAREVCS